MKNSMKTNHLPYIAIIAIVAIVAIVNFSGNSKQINSNQIEPNDYTGEVYQSVVRERHPGFSKCYNNFDNTGCRYDEECCSAVCHTDVDNFEGLCCKPCDTDSDCRETDEDYDMCYNDYCMTSGYYYNGLCHHDAHCPDGQVCNWENKCDTDCDPTTIANQAGNLNR